MRIPKGDWIIVSFFLLLSLMIFILFKFLIINTADRILIIQSDSKTYATYNLDLLKDDFELDISNPKGDFKVSVSKDKVYVIRTGCDDQICKRNIIKNSGESIVCVPYKIMLSIISDKKNNVDSVAY